MTDTCLHHVPKERPWWIKDLLPYSCTCKRLCLEASARNIADVIKLLNSLSNRKALPLLSELVINIRLATEAFIHALSNFIRVPGNAIFLRIMFTEDLPDAKALRRIASSFFMSRLDLDDHLFDLPFKAKKERLRNTIRCIHLFNLIRCLESYTDRLAHLLPIELIRYVLVPLLL